MDGEDEEDGEDGEEEDGVSPNTSRGSSSYGEGLQCKGCSRTKGAQTF